MTMVATIPEQVETVRRFNRFYTRQLGLLQDGFLRSPYSLAEVRVLYEIAHHEPTTATGLAGDLDLDPGYLSRLLQRLRERGLVEKRPSELDRRRRILRLTDVGQDAFARLNAVQRRDIEALLEGLPPGDQARLTGAMETIESLLGARPEQKGPYLLRTHYTGDMGWIVYRHGVLYSQEYGWNEEFEALVASIVADFIQRLDPKRERCWIAERDGENVGCVFLVKDPSRERVAQLRLLLVEPKARGLGIGRRLVQECTRFARQAGYERITLWTNSVLHAARRIYETEGYRLLDEAPHHSFGHELVGQTWELRLRAPDASL